VNALAYRILSMPVNWQVHALHVMERILLPPHLHLLHQVLEETTITVA